MILQVYCKKCGNEDSLFGFVTKNDLKGTKYEHLMDTITDEELSELEQAGKIQDEWDKWDGRCPNCGSNDVISF